MRHLSQVPVPDHRAIMAEENMHLDVVARASKIYCRVVKQNLLAHRDTFDGVDNALLEGGIQPIRLLWSLRKLPVMDFCLKKISKQELRAVLFEIDIDSFGDQVHRHVKREIGL
ncbi:hypothetical protein TUMSATVNIG1_61040 (plasmid) [Vibrio nigripulchritudo]|uniref:hypothetical protein n=1 Tax=Vibrio nigripulchritudo TaxID=28173 RepID=UPI00190E3E1D|nr:hypothetical protein [Vibrio nigripulchritudo]BCL74120.1 hypothetical protein VNTUMSATTG_60570 [Vibrio nigripulchritudo]BDU35495.1 hypothetical protein TUMSATVNIG1_61040 [Vibrio nigripulchritudo]